MVAIICFISAGFAFMINNASIEEVNTNAAAKVDADNGIGEIDDINKYINDESINEIVQSNVVSSLIGDKEASAYSAILGAYKLSGTNIWLHSNLDYTDRYLLCGECGNYIILGDVTKKLPDKFNYCDGASLSKVVEL